MRLTLSDEAEELGRFARRAIEAAGGDALVAAAENDPGGREAQVEPLLANLGAFDLDPRGSADELEAAAALCRSAGWSALPYPLAERLARPRDLGDVDALAVVAPVRPAATAGGSRLRWATVDLDGRRSTAEVQPAVEPARKTAFVADLRLAPVDDRDADDLALALALPCWTLLGMLDRAVADTATYVRDRRQFDQPLARFQGVQFQLTDAEVERLGLEQLALHCTWSIATRQPGVTEDALALRLAAIEAAEVVFRVAHQLHGAIGFCDETPLSWLSRHSQPLRRLPFGLSSTLAQLTRRLGARGLAGIYG